MRSTSQTHRRFRPALLGALALTLLIGACSSPPTEPSPLPLDVPTADAPSTPTAGFVEAPNGMVSAPRPQDADDQYGLNGGDGKPDWNKRIISPVTQPYLFEEPMINTSVRPIFIYHTFPNSSVLGGGRLKVYALQLRYAITERLGFIATKDGRADFDPGAGSDGWGWVDVAAGLKYAFVADEESGTMVTGGMTFEGSNGSRDVLQGNGDGGFRPFVTAAQDYGEVNTMASVGGYLPRDDDDESTYIDYHLHFSYEATEEFWPLIELNGITYVSSGNALPINEEGLDYANLGSANVTGNDIFTAAVGFRYRFSDTVDFGFAYEEPFGGRKDIFEDRYTFDLIKRF